MRAARLKSTLICALALALGASAQQAAGGSAAPGRRLALLIANGGYGSLPPLPSPARDAEKIAAVLRNDLKFDQVVVQPDVPSAAALNDAIEKFTAGVHRGDTVLFYFSGYGIQVDGDNYLLPTGFDPKDSREMARRAYSLSRVNDVLDENQPRIKVLILDACRRAPALIRVAPVEGLAQPNFGRDTLVMFSAQPGRTVPEKAGASGIFAQKLVETLQRPGLILEDICKEVQDGVGAGSEDQLPWFASTIAGKYYFIAPPPPPKPAPAPPVPVVSKEVAPGTLRDNPKDRLGYVWIPAGTFQMGCVPDDRQCQPEEKPRHPVKIAKGFWMGRTPVTVQAYRRFTEANRQKMPKASGYNSNWKFETYPMFNVSWNDANAFCKWAGGRLPTEAEWEYGARGGLDGKIYPWGNQITHAQANYMGAKNDRYQSPSTVMTFAINPWGLYDVAGNVWEWCWDSFAEYKADEAIDPKGPAGGTKKVARGGSFYSGAEHLRVSARKPVETEKGDNTTGFRCVRDEAP